MDMQWNLIHFGFSTDTGIHETIQQVPNHDEMNFCVLSGRGGLMFLGLK